MNKTGWCLHRMPGLPLEAPRSAGSGMGWNPAQEEGGFSWRERAVRAQEVSAARVSDRCWALGSTPTSGPGATLAASGPSLRAPPPGPFVTYEGAWLVSLRMAPMPAGLL